MLVIMRLAGVLVIVLALAALFTGRFAEAPLKSAASSHEDALVTRPLTTLTNLQLPAPPPLASDGSKTANNPQPDVAYNIAFSWPEDTAQRQRLRGVLHQCLGVRLAKINENGTVLVIEGEDANSLARMSPYVRLYQGTVTETDQALLTQWQEIKGQVVRFYPAVLDRPLFARIEATLPAPKPALVQVSGRLALAGNALVIQSLSIDSKANDVLLELASFSGGC